MKRALSIAALLIAAAIPPEAFCAGEKIGTVIAVKGEVNVSRDGVVAGSSLKVMDDLYLHDRVSTPEGAMLKILLTDDSVVTIDEKSTLELADYVYNTRKGIRKGALNLILGSIRSQLNKSGFAEEEFLIRTDNAIAGVKGTDFVVKTDGAALTRVFVIEGTVEVRSVFLPAVVLSVAAGQFTEVLKRQSPVPPAIMNDVLIDGLKREFAIRAEVTRPARELPRSAAVAKGDVPSLEARVEKAVTQQKEPGGGGISYSFYNPQAAGQIGLEPPVTGVGPGILPGGGTGGGAASKPASGGGKPFPRGALEEVFGGGR